MKMQVYLKVGWIGLLIFSFFPAISHALVPGSGVAAPKAETKVAKKPTQVVAPKKAKEEDEPSVGDVADTNEPEMADPVTYRQIRELMIYESNIRMECACPYSPDRIGGQCGTKSAYYQPQGKKIYCYPSDISDEQVYFYWLNNALP